MPDNWGRSEEHTSELQSQSNLVCRLLLEKTISPLLLTTASIRRVISASTTSNTAANSSVLSENWWYIAPRVTPAARTIASVPIALNPDAANSGRAASINAARVASERCSWVLRLLFIQTVRMFVEPRTDDTAR